MTLKTIWFAIYGNDLGNHMVDVDDVIVKLFVKPKVRVPPQCPLRQYIVLILYKKKALISQTEFS